MRKYERNNEETERVSSVSLLKWRRSTQADWSNGTEQSAEQVTREQQRVAAGNAGISTA